MNPSTNPSVNDDGALATAVRVAMSRASRRQEPALTAHAAATLTSAQAEATRLVAAAYGKNSQRAQHERGVHIGQAIKVVSQRRGVAIEHRANQLLTRNSAPSRLARTLRPLVALCALEGCGFDYVSLAYDLARLLDGDGTQVARRWGREIHGDPASKVGTP